MILFDKSKNFFIVVIMLLISNLLLSQENNILEKVKELNTKHKYSKSLNLLEIYSESHRDINTLWLYGHTLHLAKKYKSSQQKYKQAIELFPNNKILKLDFANKLTEAGKLDFAIKMLKPFTKIKDENQFFATKSIAKIYFWKGEYDIASNYIEKAIKLNDKDVEVLEFKELIDLSRMNSVGLNIQYSNDNQPLSVFSTELEGAYYINDFASIGLKLNTPVYNLDKTYFGVGLKAFNTLTFHKLKAKSHIEIGIDKLPNNKFIFNGLILLKKHIYKHLGVELNTSYLPYLLTNSSISKDIMELKYGLAFTWNNPNGFVARTALDINQFPSEKNLYYTASIWALSPKIKLSIFDFRVGYGFSYSDSKENTYTSINSLENVIATNWDNDQLHIDGNYEPYFTPSKIMINSIIGSIDVKPISKLKINLTGKFGFYSTLNTPYLKLKADTIAIEYFIDRQFAKEQYFPFEINTSVGYNVLSNLLIKAEYHYLSTNYYNNHLVGLKAKYLF